MTPETTPQKKKLVWGAPEVFIWVVVPLVVMPLVALYFFVSIPAWVHAKAAYDTLAEVVSLQEQALATTGAVAELDSLVQGEPFTAPDGVDVLLGTVPGDSTRYAVMSVSETGMVLLSVDGEKATKVNITGVSEDENIRAAKALAEGVSDWH